MTSQNKLGGPGKCPYCGDVLGNISFHRTICEKNPTNMNQFPPDSPHVKHQPSIATGNASDIDPLHAKACRTTKLSLTAAPRSNTPDAGVTPLEVKTAPNETHLRAVREMHTEGIICIGPDAQEQMIQRHAAILARHFPAPPTLTHEQIMEACEEARKAVGAMTPEQRAELEAYGRSIIAAGKPPALTGGDAELVDTLREDASSSVSVRCCITTKNTAFRAASRITALSAQVMNTKQALGEAYAKFGERDGQIAALEARVAELADELRIAHSAVKELQIDRATVIRDRDGLLQRITELERDKVRCDKWRKAADQLYVSLIQVPDPDEEICAAISAYDAAVKPISNP